MVLNGFIASRPKGSEPHGHFKAPTVTDRGLRQTFGGAAEYAPRRPGGRARVEKVITAAAELLRAPERLVAYQELEFKRPAADPLPSRRG